MLEALIAVTIAEITLFLAVLVVYLIVIMRRLRETAELLASVTYGVRAIEKQIANVEPHTGRLNRRLAGLSATLASAERSGAGG